jgi:S-adenosylmethionine decarboxylase
MQIGSEWLVEASGCSAASLRSVAVLHALFVRVIAEMKLNPLHEPRWHVFPGEGGITGFVMLSESHLACHTYPEHGVITLNLYCCRPRPEWDWRRGLAELLGAKNVQVRELPRAIEIAAGSLDALSPETEAAELEMVP